METKICIKCNLEKDIDNFSKKYKNKNGTQKYQTKCKECVNIEMISYRDSDNFKENRIEYDKKYYEDNKEKILTNKKEYHKNNKDVILKIKKEYRKDPINKERNKEYQKVYQVENRDKIYKYRRENPHIIAWRRILYRTLKHLNTTKQEHTVDMLGYTALELKHHLESLFTEGMSWDNYGKWEIDHKKPLTKFDQNSSSSEVNALSNLQPLWKEENIAKFNHYTE